MDTSQQMLEKGYDQVKARLEKLYATEYFRRERVSWLEAGKILFPDGEEEARVGQLHDLVREALLGETWWADLQPEYFRKSGFDHYAFITLIQCFDLKEIEREASEMTARNQERGTKLTKARLAKKEADIKQQQERKKWKSRPSEDP